MEARFDTPPKTNMSRENTVFEKENSSSNHQFSGAKIQVVKLGFHGLMEGLFPGMNGLLAMIVASRWGAAVWQSCSTRFIPVETLSKKTVNSCKFFIFSSV